MGLCDKLYYWAYRCYEDRSILPNVEDFLDEIADARDGLTVAFASLHFLLRAEDEGIQNLATKHGILTKPSSEWVQNVPEWSAEIESNIQRQKIRIPKIVVGQRTLIQSWLDVFMASRCEFPADLCRDLNKVFSGYDFLELAKPRHQRRKFSGIRASVFLDN